MWLRLPAMEGIEITAHEVPGPEELVGLYESVGWTKYISEPTRLHRAVMRSLRVVSARDGERLVGLARVVGDGLVIVYLQDILVDPAYQRRGIGQALLRTALAPYEDVRQQVLLTDDEPGQRVFYEHLGFTEVRDFADWPLRAFVKFR